MGLVGILLLVILALLVTLCLIVGTILAVYYRRKWKKDRLNALEIPDFSERPSLTLADVLNDSSIPQLRWQDVKIGMVIGKGASGLVSQGVWTPSYVTSPLMYLVVFFVYRVLIWGYVGRDDQKILHSRN